MKARKANLLVISAPSGSGKTTLVHQLLSGLEGAEFSVSYTTRARRPGEREGVDYHFVSESEFRAKVARAEFLEWAEVHGRLYGTGRADTEAVLRRGVDILLDVDVQGAAQVRRAVPDSVLIFVLPPSFAALEERLRGRRQDDPEAIEKRLAAARREVASYKDYDYLIVNENLARSAAVLEAIVLAERARREKMEDLVRPILDSFK